MDVLVSLDICLVCFPDLLGVAQLLQFTKRQRELADGLYRVNTRRIQKDTSLRIEDTIEQTTQEVGSLTSDPLRALSSPTGKQLVVDPTFAQGRFKILAESRKGESKETLAFVLHPLLDPNKVSREF
jgi:hypothetical protein